MSTKVKLKIAANYETSEALKSFLDKVCLSGIKLDDSDMAIVQWLYEQRAAIRAATEPKVI